MDAERPAGQVQIRLVQYRAEWRALYEREAARIRAALGDQVLQMEHVGSTSVPGLAAKPIIDICLAVPDSAVEADYVTAMEHSGYVLRLRDPDWFQHRLFNGPDTPVNVHVFGPGAREILRMVCFRDRLRSHPEDRLLYAQTKSSLADRPWPSVQAYADAKSEFVQRILARAARDGEVVP